MNSDSIFEYLQDMIEWQSYVDQVECIGPQLDGRMFRQMKSYFIENGICDFCTAHEDMEWINEDGRDILIHSLKKTIECKFQKGCLLTAGGKIKENLGSGVKLYNSNGTNKRKGLPFDYSKFILLLDTRAAALITKPSRAGIKIRGDSITLLGVAKEKSHIIFEHDDYEPRIRYDSMSDRDKNFIMEGFRSMVKKQTDAIKLQKKGK
jgi:hypothetical protein